VRAQLRDVRQTLQLMRGMMSLLPGLALRAVVVFVLTPHLQRLLAWLPDDAELKEALLAHGAESFCDEEGTLTDRGWHTVRSVCALQDDERMVPTAYYVIDQCTHHIPRAGLQLHAWAFSGLTYQGLVDLSNPNPLRNLPRWNRLPRLAPEQIELAATLSTMDPITMDPVTRPVYLLPNAQLQPNGRRRVHHLYDLRTIRQLAVARSPMTQAHFTTQNVHAYGGPLPQQ
jgi:hypothetical protein